MSVWGVDSGAHASVSQQVLVLLESFTCTRFAVFVWHYSMQPRFLTALQLVFVSAAQKSSPGSCFSSSVADREN